jgi:hypothetical protein
MADELLNNGDNDIFVYTGGQAPRDVRRARICESIDTVPRGAFQDCHQLIEVEGHKKLMKIEEGAFIRCRSLRRITNMGGVKEIEKDAFFGCHALSDLEFDKLEIIGKGAFDSCKSLRSINLPCVKGIGNFAFHSCKALTDAVFGKDLERIEEYAFLECTALRHIAIPLKDGFIVENNAFFGCRNLSRLDTIESIHKTISSLHLESWRGEMMEEIDRINQTLLEIPLTWETAHDKTPAIQRWIRSVLEKMEYYKVEHNMLVKEAMALLELALWKAKLIDDEGKCNLKEEGKKSKKAKIDKESARKEHRVTCGANIVIKNVLPFLALKK